MDDRLDDALAGDQSIHAAVILDAEVILVDERRNLSYPGLRPVLILAKRLGVLSRRGRPISCAERPIIDFRLVVVRVLASWWCACGRGTVRRGRRCGRGCRGPSYSYLPLLDGGRAIYDNDRRVRDALVVLLGGRRGEGAEDGLVGRRGGWSCC